MEWCDVAVWHVAKTLEELYVMNETETKGEEAKKQIGVNLQNIEELKNRIGKVGDRQKKIAENYEDGTFSYNMKSASRTCKTCAYPKNHQRF